MKATVRFFAKARDLVGDDQVDVELQDAATVADLRAALALLCPGLSALMPRLYVAVNSDYARDERVLATGDEIACFPPVSGG